MGDDRLVLSPAAPADAAAILALYRGQIGQGTSTWTERYPAMANIQSDLAAGCLYVLRRPGGIAAAVTLLGDDDGADAPDCWTPARACYPTRLCVALPLQGQGLGRQVMDALSDIARDKGYTSVRLLCAASNAAALRLYAKAGYTLCGRFYSYAFGGDYYGFEKMLFPI